MEFVGWDGVVEEFEDTASEYHLPDGQDYKQPPAPTEPSDYEKGYGEMLAMDQWSCAWVLEYADWIGHRGR